MTNKNAKFAFTLVEVLLSLVLLTVFIGAAVMLFLATMRGGQTTVDYTRASFLAHEGVEALRVIRDGNFIDVADGTYGLARTDRYSLGAAPEIIDAVIERTVTVASVYRDATGNIAISGTLDPQTKFVTVRVTFPGVAGFRREVSESTYLSNFRGNDFVNTLLADFSSGTMNNVEAVATASPPASNGALRLSTVYTPDGFFSSSDIGDHGDDIVFSGIFAFVTAEKVHEGLTIVDISNPNALSIAAELDIGNKGNGIALRNNLLGIGVDDRTRGFALVDISNPRAPTLLSTSNIGNGAGQEIVLTDTIAYVTTDRSNSGLVVVDISNPRVPSVITSLNIGGDGGGIALHNNFLIVGVADNEGAVVVDVTNPRSPRIIQRLALESGYATGIVIDFPFVYFSVANNDKELFVGSMNDSGVITIIARQNLHSGNAMDISKNGNLIAIGGSDTNRGVIIVDVTNPSQPIVINERDIDAKGNGVIFIPPSYIGVGTDTANKGFILIGAGTQGFPQSGTYTSSAIDIGFSAPEYLTLNFEGSFPAGSGISIETRSAATVAGLGSAAWSSPIISSPARLQSPSARYFQYRVTLTSDGVASPILESITFQYLP